MATATSHRSREDLLRVELTEHGRFSELLNMQVPFAIDPDVTLLSVVPEVCSSSQTGSPNLPQTGEGQDLCACPTDTYHSVQLHYSQVCIIIGC
jgi:hypothetical protein